MSPDVRYRVMSSIRKTDTKPELALRRALRRHGITGYRLHARSIPGCPDVAFTRWRVAVFVDGVFWHGHPDYFQPGTKSPYWDAKIGWERCTRRRGGRHARRSRVERADMGYRCAEGSRRGSCARNRGVERARAGSYTAAATRRGRVERAFRSDASPTSNPLAVNIADARKRTTPVWTPLPNCL